MTIASAFTLFLILGALSAIPSSSVALVVTRSVTLDIKNGLATSAGIVAGDLVLMTTAVLGMTALAEQMGAFFLLIKCLAAVYLIWFGIGLITSHHQDTSFSGLRANTSKTGNDMATSFGAGLLLTLGDIKALFFYASFLPTLLDLTALTATDIFVVAAITIVTVGIVKAFYAVAAQRLARLITKGLFFERGLKTASGGLMVSAGAYLMLKT